jgi:hypothetical protein
MTRSAAGGGQIMQNVVNNAEARFDTFPLGSSGISALRLRGIGMFAATLTLRDGSATGAVICTLNWLPTANWDTDWQTQQAPCPGGVTGTRPVVLVVTYPDGWGINLNWLELDYRTEAVPSATPTLLPGTPTASASPTPTDTATIAPDTATPTLPPGTPTPTPLPTETATPMPTPLPGTPTATVTPTPAPTRVEIEWANVINGASLGASYDLDGGGQIMQNTAQDAYARFDTFDLGSSGIAALRLRGIGMFAATVTLRDGGPLGTVLCSLTWQPTANWDTDWQTQQASCPIGFTGVRTVFVVVNYPDGWGLNLNWLELDYRTASDPTATPTPAAPTTQRLEIEAADELSGLTPQGSWDPLGGGNIALGAVNGSFARYQTVDLGSGLLRLRVRGVTEFATTLTLRVGSVTAPPLCTLTWAANANWTDWQTREVTCAGSASGVQTLYLVFSFPGGQNFAINWLEIETGG